MSFYAIELIESSEWEDFGVEKTFVQKLWNQHTRDMVDNGEKNLVTFKFSKMV